MEYNPEGESLFGFFNDMYNETDRILASYD